MKKIGLFFLALIVFITTFPLFAFAAGPKGKFIVIVADHLILEDLQRGRLPNLKELITGGAVGLMNTNTSGSRTPENTYSTVGNGVRSVGTDYGNWAFNTDEQVQLNFKQQPARAGDLYRIMTGSSVHGQVMHLGYAQMVLANSKLTDKVNIAIPATTLKVNGIRMGVFGNSDGFDNSRLASLLAVDDRGEIAIGDVGRNILRADNTFPFGRRTDYVKLKDEVLNNFNRLDYIVIETGDTSRLEQYKDYLTPEQYRRLKIKTLERIDGFLGTLLPRIDWQKDRVLLLSPTPSSAAIKNNNTVTPLVFKGKGINPGFLTSNSTRRQGIVANTDIAPTVLAFWNIKQPPGLDGRPLYSIPSAANTIESLKQLDKDLVINYNHRPPVLTTFVVLQIIYIFLAAIVILFFKSSRVLKLVQNIAIVFLILPIILIGYKAFRVESLLLTTIILLLILGLTYFILSRIKVSFYYKVAFLTLLTSLEILLDTMTGSHLIMNSPLGYDALIGARYYGIGNELSGILMGSTIIAFASAFEGLKKFKKSLFVLAVAYFILLAYVEYAPSLGADAGGLITTVLAMGFFSLRLLGKHIGKKEILSLGILTMILLGAGAFIDMTINQSKGSHIGQDFRLLVQGNFDVIGAIIVRKLAVNIRLLNFTIWTKVLLASLVALGVLLYRPVGFFKRLETSTPYMKKGFEAVFVASIVGFAVNDSGIVQATTTFIYLIFPLLYLSLVDKIENIIPTENSEEG